MKQWMKYVRPYRLFFVLGPLCMIVEVIGEVLMPRYLARIINLAEQGTLTVANGIGQAALMVLTALLMMAGGVGGAWYGAKASVNFAADLRQDVYARVQTFSFANIDKFSTGSLVTRLTNDVTQLQNFVNMLLRMFLRAPGMLIGALIMAFTLRPSLAVVFCVSVPLMLVAVLFIIRTGFSRFAAMQTRIDALNNTVQENVTNVRVVKSFVREEYENRKFGDANRELKRAGMSAMKVMIFMHPVMTLFMNLTVTAVLWFGGNMVLDAGMPVGDLSAFVTYVNQILFSLMMVTVMLMNSSRALASARRIREVLDEETDIPDTATADYRVTAGRVEFKNVSFRYYKTAEEPVLRNIDLTIEAGQTVGIIGSTGCGKSTLVSLIPRLYDTDEGAVLVDGVDVRDYPLHALRDGIGMVLQKNVLFSGSIAYNLRWGDEEASDEAMYAAAENAQADKFIRTFKDGYDTALEQGGANVSGGQKQRLCIARALLKSPKILILDDSTSAVDTATEAQIRHAFANELKGSTKILIAQRISSVMEADTIVVMDDGAVVDVGTHQELLARCEEYGEIYYSQMEKEADARG
ncbi:MAG: ABC transporter ATP-binding protein [Ruminococcaceae bacterium]|nr:ABC transporter ATP-binding protein [Oscillospiraceae bacterium]